MLDWFSLGPAKGRFVGGEAGVGSRADGGCAAAVQPELQLEREEQVRQFAL